MELKDIRNKINLIDKEMAKLFEERMKVKRQEDPAKRERRLKVYNALIKTLKT